MPFIKVGVQLQRTMQLTHYFLVWEMIAVSPQESRTCRMGLRDVRIQGQCAIQMGQCDLYQMTVLSLIKESFAVVRTCEVCVSKGKIGIDLYGLFEQTNGGFEILAALVIKAKPAAQIEVVGGRVHRQALGQPGLLS